MKINLNQTTVKPSTESDRDYSHNFTNTDKINNNRKNKEKPSFIKLYKKKRKPREITYDEYKELTKDDINILYPKDSMIEFNNEAVSLYIKVKITSDEILNKVLFEKELKLLQSIDMKYLIPLNKAINKLFDIQISLVINRILIDDKFMNSDTIESYYFKISKKIDKLFKVTKVAEYRYDSERSVSLLLYTFNYMIEKFKTEITKGNHDKDSHFYKGLKTIILYCEDINSEYYKRRKENSALLFFHRKILKFGHQTIIG